ncbi:polysaccharide pyruvyl transferase family protein [Paenibacillus sp. WLX1005]|uniref:polysaccharide pyruvyl transferase family protein n=1 Tax=Paenibacillus sp. WLX1005 TaxID=3243766 RepID=UPI003984384A
MNTTTTNSKGKPLVKGIAPNASPEALTNDKRKVFLFGSPSYTNIGDQAIAYAIERFIRNHFPYYEYIEIMDYATDEGITLVQEIIRDDDIVCFTGGGNLGSLYTDIEEDRRKVISSFHNHRTIVFPQSVYFEDNDHGEQEKRKTQDAYHSNANLTLVGRENQTIDVLAETFAPDVNIMYTPDMVMSLDIVPKELKREGVLFVMRADKEKVTDEPFLEELKQWAQQIGKVERIDTVLDEVDTIDYAEREHYLMNMLDTIGSQQLIITDRLHAMIFSIITRTPCLVFGNSYGKAKHSHIDWLHPVAFIEYTDSKDVQELEHIIERLMNADREGIDLRSHFEPLKEFFKQK